MKTTAYRQFAVRVAVVLAECKECAMLLEKVQRPRQPIIDFDLDPNRIRININEASGTALFHGRDCAAVQIQDGRRGSVQAVQSILTHPVIAAAAASSVKCPS